MTMPVGDKWVLGDHLGCVIRLSRELNAQFQKLVVRRVFYDALASSISVACPEV
jgi:hypothetical protein